MQRQEDEENDASHNSLDDRQQNQQMEKPASENDKDDKQSNHDHDSNKDDIDDDADNDSSENDSKPSSLDLQMREQQLKDLLKEHYGSTKNKQVQKLILEDLTPFNPTPEPTKSPLLLGNFICHTIPEFPGRLRKSRATQEPLDPSIIQYTLGRLSFGIFEPNDLVCTIRSVRQCLQVRLQTRRGVFRTLEYPIMMDLTIHAAAGDLPAVVSHDAVCYQCPGHAHRLKIRFTGSTLYPARETLNDPVLLQVWMDTFAGAYEKAAAEKGFFSRTFQSLVAWWFQISLPNDEELLETENHSVHFEMKRSPRGYLDVLYLSATTRITRGNRGTLVVVEPMAGGPDNAAGSTEAV